MIGISRFLKMEVGVEKKFVTAECNW